MRNYINCGSNSHCKGSRCGLGAARHQPRPVGSDAHLLGTGGAGFIGSHTCVVLLNAGHRLIVLDDFSNSSPLALERVAELADVILGEEQLQLMRGDIRDAAFLEALFSEAKPPRTVEAVIHFAGLGVGESVADPLRYWDVNVCGSRALFTVMDANAAERLSSAVAPPSMAIRMRCRSPKPLRSSRLIPTATPKQRLNACFKI